MNRIPLHSSAVCCVVLAQRDGITRMLLLERAQDGYWCHPAGTVEAGETAAEAMVRELREEISVCVDTFYSADYVVQFYDSAANALMLVPAFVCEIAADAVIRLNHEHRDHGWFTLEQACASVPFPNQRALYQHVWRNFVDSRPSSQLRIK